MPMFRWKCPKCGNKLAKILVTRPTDYQYCSVDKERMESDLLVSEQVMERRDNGIMPRAVDQLKDVDEMVRERSKTTEDPKLV